MYCTSASNRPGNIKTSIAKHVHLFIQLWNDYSSEQKIVENSFIIKSNKFVYLFREVSELTAKWNILLNKYRNVKLWKHFYSQGHTSEPPQITPCTAPIE